ncbi:hypothetical protein B0H14DRAFT_3136307 [Mycena olivaceomarginata]|nr:hypothetical protein B0H14DRAFT_3136307 [Mycena olivaceomarginata]
MNLQQLVSAQQQHPSLSTVNLHGLTSLRMACLAQPLIEFQQEDRRRPSISETNLALVHTCWIASKEVIWNHPEIVPIESELTRYNGPSVPGLILPKLSRLWEYNDAANKATFHTLRNRSLPVYTTSLKIFIAVQILLRTYYGGFRIIFKSLSISLSRARFSSSSQPHGFGWLSSSNWARIYNASLSRMNFHIANNKIAELGCSQNEDTEKCRLGSRRVYLPADSDFRTPILSAKHLFRLKRTTICFASTGLVNDVYRVHRSPTFAWCGLGCDGVVRMTAGDSRGEEGGKAAVAAIPA